jgi:hypothetical protein
MEISRDYYLNQLVSRMWNGQVKVITGIRRCGKSYLLKTLFKRHLIESGVAESDILTIELDEIKALKYRNPLELSKFVDAWKEGATRRRYLFIDEIQMCEEVPNPYLPQGAKITFYDALNGFLHKGDLDVYVTGSNSKMLSSDIRTEFRGRGDEVRVHPLSFAEYLSAKREDKRDAFDGYMRFGGMPFAVTRADDASREAYLKSLFDEVYLKDIVERRKIERPDAMGRILDFLCSTTGSLTNANNIAASLLKLGDTAVSPNTVASYIGYLEDSYLFSEAKRYDIKGHSYFEYPQKYYCEDIGLRNARSGFRHQEETHIMENMIYNELVMRGYSVDVGVVMANERNALGKNVRVAREIDFVVNRAGERLYIQSAYALPTDEKRLSELKPFSLTGDSFRKIIVRTDVGKRWFDENGVLNLSIYDFLLDQNAIK